ncbi:MAG TPA: indolepyruvate ferredoxin oxidoreductase subunit alpha [Candidatus Latescibacteria bacterium]|nr:indolepyruvate ferredoxin oxidoreductase subunit alpha [Candidatus Latescibacterota bacterium]
MRKVLLGNEAIARGAYEAGVAVAAGYPGTPSTEILENLARYGEIYCEWAPNEKVALEVAAGACWTGVRAIATMKHVGLNVAADPLMTLSYTGVRGGLVVVVADDPGMYSSQNEQDSRNYAKFAKVPLLEPSDSQEAKDFVGIALEISERFDTPVLLRSTTRLSHSRGVVALDERKAPPAPSFKKDPQKLVMLPLYARGRRRAMEERIAPLREFSEAFPHNRIIWRDRRVGVIASGVCYQYAEEVFPDASILKLGMTYPFPDGLIMKFAEEVEEVLVVEELDPFLEEHIRSLGIRAKGREYFPGVGELDPDRVLDGRLRWEGRPVLERPQEPGLPPRPPVMCPGCPHRGVFYVLSGMDVVITGDIGCYTLAVFPPLNAMDTLICMGAGISASMGMAKAGLEKPVVGVIGDSTFFHSGMTGLLDIAYNEGNVTIVVLDNRTTAMTGHQDHPGTGITLTGEETREARIEEVVRAFGIPRVRVVDPYNLEETRQILKEEVAAPEASAVISRRPCVLLHREYGPPYLVDPDLCTGCRRCLRLGCPALERVGRGREVKVRIDPLLCTGCGLCAQVCRFDAIGREEG